MAWTTPRTWVAAELVTATQLNTHLRDNDNALRDYMLGAQDLGSDWKLSSGRLLRFADTDVAHGMTAIEATDVWLSFVQSSATAGGAQMRGLSDTDSLGLTIYGINGSATPTAGGIQFTPAKKSGTTIQAFASSELAMVFSNAGASNLGLWYGSGLDVVGGLAVGYTGAPTTNWLTIGDANFRLGLSGASPFSPFILASSGGFGLVFDRTVGAEAVAVKSVGLRLSTSGDGSGGAPTGAILFDGEKLADPTAPAANCAIVYLKDNGAGKTQLLAIFSSGAAQLLAIQP